MLAIHLQLKKRTSRIKFALALFNDPAVPIAIGRTQGP